MKFDLSRLLSLKVILTIPLVLQLLVVVVGISWLADRSARQVVNHLTLLLLEDIGDHLEGEINHFLERPVTITQEYQDLLDLEILTLSDPDLWGPYLYKQYQTYRHHFLTAFMISNPANEFRAAGHIYNQKGQRVEGLARVGKETDYHFDTYSSIEDYQRRRNAQQLSNAFIATKRPWYIQSAKTGEMQWTTLFTRQVYEKDLAINFSRPLYNGDRSQMLGVASIQLDLAYLNQYLQSFKIGQSGSIFIIDNQGYLIANSDGQSQLKIVDDKAVPLLMGDSSNPIFRSIAEEILDLPVSGFKRQYLPEFTLDFQRYFVLTLPLQAGNGLQWLAVIAIPQSDFLAVIWENQRLTFLLSSLSLLIASIVGLVTAYFISKPITHLSQAIVQLSQGNGQKNINLSAIKELKAIAQGFQAMANQLQGYVGQLQEQEQQLRQFLEAIPISVGVFDLQNQSIFINEQEENFVNLALESLQPTIQKTFGGESFYADGLTVDNHGISITLELWVKPIFNRDNEIIFAMIVAQDITKRKQAEKLLKNYNQTLTQAVKKQTQRLLEAKEKAEVANQAKSRLLTNMSHELKTPLHAILGFTKLVINDSKLPINLTQSLIIVRKNAIHLLTLITNLLDLAKIEANKLAIQPQSINLIDFLQDIEEIFRLSAQIKNLDFSIHWQTPCPRLIRVDITKLRQIFLNLLSNAFKFTALGGVSITVACHKGEKDPDQLHVWIKDTGMGICQSDQEYLFDAFYRGENPQPLIEGTGLGLTLTQQYIQLLGGEIFLESEIEQGTCFYFWLPVTILTSESWLAPNFKVDPKSEVISPALLTANDINHLPSPWCSNFYDALTSLDDTRMLALLADIKTDYPEISQSLEVLINGIEMQRLLDLFSRYASEKS